jgi:hypothetical protein
MSSRSTILQPSIAYDVTRVLPYVTQKIPGDGYFGSGDGNHTLQVSLDSFIGVYHIEASIANNPTEADWITIKLASGAVSQSGNLITDVTYVTSETSTKIYNFTGNFTWIRAVAASWTAGTISNILLNH